MKHWVSIDDVISYRPCYTPYYIRKLAAPARFCVTFKRFASLNIPKADKLWVVTRIGLVFTYSELGLLLCDAWPECYVKEILLKLKDGYTAVAFNSGGIDTRDLATIYNTLSAAAFRRFGVSLGEII